MPVALPEFGVHLTEQQVPSFDPNQPTLVMVVCTSFTKSLNQQLIT